MAAILRDVGEHPDSYNIPDDELPTRLCMHAGPYESRFWHATGAMITDSSEDGVLVWMTATSATDLSRSSPVLRGSMPEMSPPPRVPIRRVALVEHERLHRRRSPTTALRPEIRGEFDLLEQDFFRMGRGSRPRPRT